MIELIEKYLEEAPEVQAHRTYLILSKSKGKAAYFTTGGDREAVDIQMLPDWDVDGTEQTIKFHSTAINFPDAHPELPHYLENSSFKDEVQEEARLTLENEEYFSNVDLGSERVRVYLSDGMLYDWNFSVVLS